jgi:hypothetical protein
MPKKKKTRKQKALADVRRQTVTVSPHTATTEVKQTVREEHQPAPTPEVPRPQKSFPHHAIATTDYHYLSHDLRKTLILTAAILGIQIILKQVAGI